MLAVLASPGLFDDLSRIHHYPILLALAIAGLMSVFVMTVCLILRAYAEVYESVYDLRRRCAAIRCRFREKSDSG